MAKNNIIFYRQWWEAIRELTPAQQAAAYDSLLQYAFDGIEPTDAVIRAVTAPMRESINREIENYERICERNRMNGMKGGAPKNNNNARKTTQNNPKQPKTTDWVDFSESETTTPEIITPDIPTDEQPTAPTETAKTDIEQQFEEFRAAYPGRKRGFKTEWENFKKKNPKTYRDIVPLLFPALQRLIAWNERATAAGQFVANFKNLSTWLNQQCWTEEFPELNETSTATQPITPTPRNYDSDDDFGGAKY
ncbi:MAG: DUF6291 domain-containing protein [Ruminococcus sp.]|nr:DUF6291 domain-containing protein [Ruminococcus sp.]MCM1438984.1 DUF6291 domain-containing protein [Roseburia sp.]